MHHEALGLTWNESPMTEFDAQDARVDAIVGAEEAQNYPEIYSHPKLSDVIRDPRM